MTGIAMVRFLMLVLLLCCSSGAFAADFDGDGRDDMADGLFTFLVSGCVTQAGLDFTITYPQSLPAGTQYWKYGPTLDNTTPHWYVLPSVISGNTVHFSIADGGLGDDDMLANGSVAVAAAGPGALTPVPVPVPVPPTGASPIPTLQPALLGLMALLIAGMGCHAANRRSSGGAGEGHRWRD
jgi:hypothetical protein